MNYLQIKLIFREKKLPKGKTQLSHQLLSCCMLTVESYWGSNEHLKSFEL